ncbi:MAG: hypothetical protein IJN90_04865 [Bacilli bacterium]|nr:hypothetical protein [Bacilli bacterium]
MKEVKADNLQEKKQKLKNLRVFKAGLGILACVTALVQNPVMLGVSVAANLGTILAESVIDNAEDTLSTPNSSKAVAVR